MRLRLGRRVDRAFTGRILSGARSGDAGVRVRIRSIVAELAARGVHIGSAQVKVGMSPAIRIRTELAGLGCLLDGTPVVIEVKASTATLAEYRAAYNAPCMSRRRLVTGHPNTTATHHQLQTAFGALAIGATRGVIVISCADGVMSHLLETRFLDRAVFERAIPPSRPGRPRCSNALPAPTMATWPAADAPLRAALARATPMGGWTLVPAPPASARMTGPAPGDTAVLCIIVGRSTPSKLRSAGQAADEVGGAHRYALVQTARAWRVVPLP